MKEENWKQKLTEIAQDIVFEEPMKEHTSFKIGGPAEAFIRASSTEEIGRVVSFCKQQEIPFLVMGNGSNMLVSDKGIRGVVLQVGDQMKECRAEGNLLWAQAGILLSALSNAALRAGLSGIEFAAGIPGTLGGGIYMNAGAYGGELKDVIKSVTYLDEEGIIRTCPAEEMGFGYRKSIFSGRSMTILECTMQLIPDEPELIKGRMVDFNRRRSDKQPLSMPSAGSTFKRPEGYFAGKLIQDAGLMGYQLGGAQVSEKHAGFVVNAGDATAADVLALIEHIQHTVQDKFGVHLEPEVKLIGEQECNL